MVRKPRHASVFALAPSRLSFAAAAASHPAGRVVQQEGCSRSGAGSAGSGVGLMTWKGRAGVSGLLGSRGSREGELLKRTLPLEIHFCADKDFLLSTFTAVKSS